jgi:hypothetical protein
MVAVMLKTRAGNIIGDGAPDLPFDPILSPNQMCDEAGIDMDTWRRYYRRKLPIIQLSPKRIGCRQSAWQAELASRTEQAA